MNRSTGHKSGPSPTALKYEVPTNGELDNYYQYPTIFDSVLEIEPAPKKHLELEINNSIAEDESSDESVSGYDSFIVGDRYRKGEIENNHSFIIVGPQNGRGLKRKNNIEFFDEVDDDEDVRIVKEKRKVYSPTEKPWEYFRMVVADTVIEPVDQIERLRTLADCDSEATNSKGNVHDEYYSDHGIYEGGNEEEIIIPDPDSEIKILDVFSLAEDQKFQIF